MRSFFVGAALSIAASLSLGAVGTAAAQTMNALSDADTAMIFNFDYPTIAPLLDQYGYAHEPTSYYGNDAIKVSKNQTVMMLLPTVCRGAGNDNGCVGLAMLGFFRDSVSDAQNTAFNNRLFFSHAETTTDGNTVIERYLISDHGFSKRTFGVELEVFAETIQAYGSFINAYRQTVSFDSDQPAPGKIGNGFGTGGEPGRGHLRRRPLEAAPGAFNDGADAVNDPAAFPALVAE